MAGQQPDFDSIKRTNVLGQEYWSARELMPLLGYDKWQNFEKVIQEAMIAASDPESGLKLDENFTAVSKVSGKRGPAQKDYFLSKRACYLIAQNGDPRKSEIAAAMNYFAFTAEIFDIAQARLMEQQRLQLRLKVAEGNAELSSTALNSGVQQKNMGIFHDAGYVGMYRMTEDQLAAFWNIGPNERILDVMGPEALAANLFRITQTDAKLKRDQVRNEDIAIATHHDVGTEVRRAIENIHQKKPEDLPRAANIRKLVEEERRKAKKRLKKSQQEQAEPSLFDELDNPGES
jgi:DNA-damage-inducible protein D